MIIIDLAIKSTLAAGLGWSAVFMLRRSSASTRHAALFIILVGVSLVPAVSSWIPQWHVPFLQVRESTHATTESGQVALSTGAGSVVYAHAPAAASALSTGEILLAVWLGVAAFLCLRLVVRLVKLARAEKHLPMSIDLGLQKLVAELCRKSGRHVVLLEGAANEPPMTWGYSRPVLVLPADAGAWPEDRLNSVVLHELAHIERGDWLASVFAQLACAVYWFNPLVWMIRKRMEIESETAADDRVLGLGVSATQYASHLVGVTKELRAARSSTEVALAMARPGSLDRRVRAILEARRCRRSVRGIVTLGLAATVAGVVVVVGAAAPTIVRDAFSSPPEVTVSSEKLPDANDAPTGIFSDDAGKIQAPPEMILDSSDVPAEMEQSQLTSGATESPATHTQAAPVAPKPPTPVVAVRSDPHQLTEPVRLEPLGQVMSKEDIADFEAAMKEANVKIDVETQKAFKDLAHVKIDTSKIMEMVGAVTAASTKAAIEQARKTASVQIKLAVDELRHKQRETGPPQTNRSH